MSRANQLTPAEVLDLLGPVVEDLDEILNKTFGTKLGYEIVSIQDDRTLTLYQALGNAHRYTRIVYDRMSRLNERGGQPPSEPLGAGHVNGE